MVLCLTVVYVHGIWQAMFKMTDKHIISSKSEEEKFHIPNASVRQESAVYTSGLSTLQVFSNDGVFQNRFGVRGRSPGQLQRPTGVAVHPNGDIIIADYDNKWVSIFSSEGKFKVGLSS